MLFSNDTNPPDFRKPTTAVVTTQLGIAILLGVFAFLSFCILLKKLPRLYASRRYKEKDNIRLPTWDDSSLFAWIPVLYKINDQQVLEYAGLDAFVFLSFFKMSLKLIALFSLFALTIISPIRYHFTGQYDDGNDQVSRKALRLLNDSHSTQKSVDWQFTGPEAAYSYLWMYVIFTYFFTYLALKLLMRETTLIVDTRQKFLGKQNTVTDRTIRVTGIPIEYRNNESLKRRMEELQIGKVASITICREWGPLIRLFHYRSKIMRMFELYYVKCPAELRNDDHYVENYSLQRSPSEFNEINNDVSANMCQEPFSNTTFGGNSPENNTLYSQIHLSERPKMKIRSWYGFQGKEVDALDYLFEQMKFIDKEIEEARKQHYSATPTAFITMDSVANAQMAAQAVLDPRVHYFITRLAPAPHDVRWDNVCLSRRERLTKVYSVTVFIGISSIFLIIPVSYLATLLNMKTISKFWPSLGNILEDNKWAENIVTGLLPTYLFTLMNIIIPYFYEYLTGKQGLVSHSEEEISLVSKNFFYIFVNLFLVFTLAGTASNYWGYLSDTTKIAYQLATSVKEFALFYVDLIILQGIGMFPFKLLLVGSLIGFPFIKSQAKTPRQRNELYTPPIFNFGLQLPQPILILIITIIYSVMSTKILVSSLAYFIIGYYVYKYQLIYATDHLPHSTGRVWPLIFRRVILGLLLFQLTMVGTLAGFVGGWILSSCLFPLPFITLSFLWDFEKNYLPLAQYIALSSIREHERDNATVSNSSLDDGYQYPYLVSNLDGPIL